MTKRESYTPREGVTTSPDLASMVSNVASVKAKDFQGRMARPEGGVPNARSFSQAEGWDAKRVEDQPRLRPETANALDEVAEYTRDTASFVEEAPEEVVEEPLPLNPILAKEEKRRRALEQQERDLAAKLTSIDIGQFLMSGSAQQTVEVFKGHLSVTFRSAREGEETAALRVLRNLIDDDMMEREFSRSQSQVALALHIHAYNGTAWPALNEGMEDSKLDELMRIRMEKVDGMPTPVALALYRHMAWFLKRVTNAITQAELGNG